MFEMREKQRVRGARNQGFECASIIIDLRLPSVGEQGHVNCSDHARARQDRFPVLHGEGAVERLHEYSDQSKPYCLQMTHAQRWLPTQSQSLASHRGKVPAMVKGREDFSRRVHLLRPSTPWTRVTASRASVGRHFCQWQAESRRAVRARD